MVMLQLSYFAHARFSCTQHRLFSKNMKEQKHRINSDLMGGIPKAFMSSSIIEVDDPQVLLELHHGRKQCSSAPTAVLVGTPC